MRCHFIVVACEQCRVPTVRAGRVILVDIPSVNVAGEKIGVRNPGDAAVKLKVARGDIAPVCIVLVDLVELASNFDGVFAANQGEDIGDVVYSFAQNGTDVAVFVASGAQSHASGAGAGIDRDFGKHVGRSIGAIRRLQTDGRGNSLSKGWWHVLIELAACTYAKLVQQRRADRIYIRKLAGEIVVISLGIGCGGIWVERIGGNVRHLVGVVVKAEGEPLFVGNVVIDPAGVPRTQVRTGAVEHIVVNGGAGLRDGRRYIHRARASRNPSPSVRSGEVTLKL